MYLVSNTIIYISFTIHQCYIFTNKTKESNEISVKRICRYLQGTKDKILSFNPSKKIMVDFYVNAYFQDFGDIKTLKTLFLLGLGLYLW